MKVAIMGTGPGGAYLHALLHLRRPDVDADVYCEPRSERCGVKSCGWAVSKATFAKLCSEVGLDSGCFTRTGHNTVLINGTEVNARVAVIDKPALIAHLLTGVQIRDYAAAKLSAYDRVIDCTGAKRAYLDSALPMPVAHTLQVKLHSTHPHIVTRTLKHGGYSWHIPLGDGLAHVGSAGMSSPKEHVQCLMDELHVGPTVCACTGRIAYGGPWQPYVNGRTWGLGEAIGLVDPVTGAGITPAMHSATLMVQNWDNEQSYTSSIGREFKAIKASAKVVMKLTSGTGTGLSDLPAVIKSLALAGVHPTFWQARGLRDGGD